MGTCCPHSLHHRKRLGKPESVITSSASIVISVVRRRLMVATFRFPRQQASPWDQGRYPSVWRLQLTVIRPKIKAQFGPWTNNIRPPPEFRP